MARVSLVIPVYNAEKYLRQCLDSAVGQTLEDIEIICVDNGSSDGSGPLLAEYAARDARVTIVELRENVGPSGGRNAGLDVATGEFVLFFDSDDFLEATALEDAYAQCALDDADIGIFKIRYVYEDRDEPVDADWSLRMDMVPDTLPFDRSAMAGSIFRFVTPAVWNKLFKREFLMRERLRFAPNLRGTEDVTFTYLALLKARRITVVDKALINFRAGQSASLGTSKHERPREICEALALTRQGAIDAGILAEVEVDLANAALHQCLFTLGRFTTLEAFKDLYEAMKLTYFAELGIDALPPEEFFSPEDHERYLRIRALTAETYLFEESRALARQRTEAADKNRALRERLDASREESHSVRAVLREKTAELRAKRAESKAASTQRDAAKRRLERILESRSYRLSQRIARVSKAASRLLPRSRRAG